MRKLLILFMLTASVMGSLCALAQPAKPKATASCDPSNPRHVSGKEAFGLANKENDDTFCWDYIAAMQGYPTGESAWASDLYNSGPEYYKESFAWAQKSQKGGSIYGAYLMAIMYNDGKGVPANHTKSQYWWDIAMKDPDLKELAEHQQMQNTFDALDKLSGPAIPPPCTTERIRRDGHC